MNQTEQMRNLARKVVDCVEARSIKDWDCLHMYLSEAAQMARQALATNHNPDTGKMGNYVGDNNKMLELFDQVVSPAILNCIGKMAEEITVRRIWDEVRRAMLKNNGVRHD